MATESKNSSPVAAMIVDSMSAGEPELGDEGSEEEVSEGEMAAAEEAMSALQSNDVSAFARALRSLVHML